MLTRWQCVLSHWKITLKFGINEKRCIYSEYYTFHYFCEKFPNGNSDKMISLNIYLFIHLLYGCAFIKVLMLLLYLVLLAETNSVQTFLIIFLCIIEILILYYTVLNPGAIHNYFVTFTLYNNTFLLICL